MEHDYESTEYGEDFERELPLEDQPLEHGFDDPELGGSWDEPGDYDDYDDEFDDLDSGPGSRRAY